MSLVDRTRTRRTTPVAVAALLDVVVVLVFAAVGRASHGEQDAVTGVLAVAWPFLAGAAVGWAVARLRGRWPLDVRCDGVLVWASTLVLGMLLRVVSGAGTAPSFVVVAGLFLALTLLGWRLLAPVVTSRRP
ncbi:DUF3054 domain-containing protein [Lapillicoccus jejuensis]|uniref:DUF3054 family protein n=1 Tax=Lapillicoccus jejuensis TaxID=402171 RepID=A0A542E4Q6_9MICO|nr:DUF3054 domain-containing protein [Lapillicoccus jejuensis]TQJ10307.1 DUF3054 family protein [Lapillicoccus jejuensis]